MLEELEESGEVSEDDAERALEELQKLTDKAISDIDALLATKDKEIMEV
jgi:ribosome recycling factor